MARNPPDDGTPAKDAENILPMRNGPESAPAFRVYNTANSLQGDVVQSAFVNEPTPFVMRSDDDIIARLNRNGSAEFDWKRIEAAAKAWHPDEKMQHIIIAKLLVGCAEQIMAQTEARFVQKSS